MDIGTLTGAIALEDQVTDTLSTVRHNIVQFAEDAEGWFGVAAVTVGVLTAAVLGLAISIEELGKRGSDVNHLTETLDRFSGSAQQSEAIMEEMRKGTLNTVEDFALLQNSTRLLAAGVKLTAEDFGTLTSAATVLQNQGLGPTKDMLELVSQALLTGRTRSLEMAIGKIDLSKAERNYAESLGLTKDELTEVQKTEARRIGILEALQRRVKEAGDQQRDFADIFAAAETAVRNWFDSLASAVAKSPNVLRALNAIGDALVENFGHTGQTILETLVGWINKFADSVAYYGPIIIRWLRATYDWLVEIFVKVKEEWNALPSWLQQVAKDSFLAAAGVKVLNEGLKVTTGGDILTTVASFATIWAGFGKGIGGAIAAVKLFGQTMIAAFQLGGVTMVLEEIAAYFGGIATAATIATGAVTLFFAGIFAGYEINKAALQSVKDGIDSVAEADRQIEALQSQINILMKDPDGRHEAALMKDELKAIIEKRKELLKITEDQTKKDMESAEAAMNALSKWESASERRAVMGDDKPASPVSDNVQKLIDQYSGKELAKQIRELSAAYDGLSEHTKASLASQLDFGKVLSDLADKGAVIPAKLQPLVTKYRDIAFAQDEWTDSITKQRMAQEKADREAIEAINTYASNEEAIWRMSAATSHATDTYDKFAGSIVITTRMLNPLDAKLQDLGVTLEGELTNNVNAARQAFIDLYNSGAGINQLTAAWQKFKEEQEKLWQFQNKALLAHAQNLQNLAGAIRSVASIFGGFIGQTISGIGNLVDSWSQAIVMAKRYGDGIEKVSKTQAALSLAQGAASVWSATSEGTRAQRVTGGVLSGAASGAAFGAMFGPQGAVIGAAIGAVAGAVVALSRKMNEGRLTVVSFFDSFGGADELRKRLLSLGEAGDELWVTLTQRVGKGDKDAANAAIKAIQAALEDLDQTVKKYNLDWTNLADPTEKFRQASVSAQALYLDYKKLITAGYDEKAVINGMAQPLNDWLANALKAGVKIPAALAPIIEKLITSHQLTEENARAMLGYADDAVPSLADIEAAAARYGLTLDQLGPKVQQIRINEEAQQIIKDFDLLTKAGVPFDTIVKDTILHITDTGAVFEDMGEKARKAYLEAGGVLTEVTVGMHDSIQKLVTDSLTLGTTLPMGLKPIIDQLIKAGGPNGLVDQFGNALTDVSELDFEVPLTDRIADLVSALKDLIEVIKGPNGLGAAIDGIPDIDVGVRVHPPPEGFAPDETAGGGYTPSPNSGQDARFGNSVMIDRDQPLTFVVPVSLEGEHVQNVVVETTFRAIEDNRGGTPANGPRSRFNSLVRRATESNTSTSGRIAS